MSLLFLKFTVFVFAVLSFLFAYASVMHGFQSAKLRLIVLGVCLFIAGLFLSRVF